MDDLEMVRKCAVAMGYVLSDYEGFEYTIESPENMMGETYNPLHDDAQAMALVVKLRLRVMPQMNSHWCADNGEPTPYVRGGYFLGQGNTPNRAIVECVAKMEDAK